MAVVIVVVDVDIVVVTGSDDVVVISSFFGAKTTNINTRERIIANIISTIKDMPMILTQVYCHHLRGSIFLGTFSSNT
jgi:hypothetical protein